MEKRPLGIPTVGTGWRRWRRSGAGADSRRTFVRARTASGQAQCDEALETLRKLVLARSVLDADIRDYFGSIDHDKLCSRRISDWKVLKLLRSSGSVSVRYA